MISKKDNYPGFIKGLKASNIASNKASLTEYSELISGLLNQITINCSEKDISEFLTDNIRRAESIIKETTDIWKTSDDLIRLYIKFGSVFQSIVPEVKVTCGKEIISKVTVKYLNIAKYTSDTRIKEIAIAIAKLVDGK